MSVTQTAATSGTQRHNMLWSRAEDGTWLTEDPDAVRWNRDHVVQCAAITYPRVIAGETVPGDRCKNTMRVGYPKWWIAPGDVPIVLCWAHAKSASARWQAAEATRTVEP